MPEDERAALFAENQVPDPTEQAEPQTGQTETERLKFGFTP